MRIIKLIKIESRKTHTRTCRDRKIERVGKKGILLG